MAGLNQLALLASAWLAVAGIQVIAAGHPLEVDKTEWAAYKLAHGKHYADPQVDLMRSMIYAANKLKIEQFNLQETRRSYTKGLNRFSDWTEAEVSSLKGLKLPSYLTSVDQAAHNHQQLNSPEAEQFLQRILRDNSTGPVPDELDWRQVPGRVSRVRDQGKCGSCWAFATMGLLEGQEVPQVNASLREAIQLSVQNLIDCVGDDEYGCNGGWMADGLEFIKRQGGIESDASYPYYAIGGQCHFNRSLAVMSDSGYALLPAGDELRLKQVVARYGPVSVGIDATENFLNYKEGVLDDQDCYNNKGNLNHGVLVVGYGTHPTGGDYWLVKNSWGSRNWGLDGYIRMARNKGNQCGIATLATIATF